jgi:hypothetical protein
LNKLGFIRNFSAETVSSNRPPGNISEAEKRSKKKLLLDYLYTNLKNHNFWAYRYFFCEFLALLNVFGELGRSSTIEHTQHPTTTKK